MVSPKMRRNQQSSLPSSIKLVGLEENNEMSRNLKSSSITPFVSTKRFSSTVNLQRRFENKTAINLKLVKERITNHQLCFIDELFNDDYLKENQEEINKYLKRNIKS